MEGVLAYPDSMTAVLFSTLFVLFQQPPSRQFWPQTPIAKEEAAGRLTSRQLDKIMIGKHAWKRLDVLDIQLRLQSWHRRSQQVQGLAAPHLHTMRRLQASLGMNYPRNASDIPTSVLAACSRPVCWHWAPQNVHLGLG